MGVTDLGETYCVPSELPLRRQCPSVAHLSETKGDSSFFFRGELTVGFSRSDVSLVEDLVIVY